MLTPRRVDEPELLDEHDAPHDQVRRSLLDLRRINRYLGGRIIYRRLLRRFRGAQSLLDLGTGSADLPDCAGVPMRIGLDSKIEHLLARSRHSPTKPVIGDASRLPFRPQTIDVVTSAHFFHHFSPEENTAILREALRVCRMGVAINDTRRHYVPLLFIRLLAALRLVGAITRFDGPASVRRGYTVREVRSIAAGAGAARSRVMSVFPFRFALLLWK